MFPLLAVHLSDNLLAAPWWLTGWLLTAILLAWSSHRISDREIPKTALMSAAFFVSSSIHLQFGLTSVHLLLTGLIGSVLGRRAPLAIMVGLVLQAVLLRHGGYLILGLNTLIMSLPAMIVPAIFRRWLLTTHRAFIYGFVVGFFSVLFTLFLHSSVLIVGGLERFQILVGVGVIAHLPLALIEGAMLGTICRFLVIVQPDLLGLPIATATRSEPINTSESAERQT